MTQAVTIPATTSSGPLSCTPMLRAKGAGGLRSGWYILGKEVSAFEQAFAAYLGARGWGLPAD